MATKPTLDGVIARKIFAALGQDFAEILDALSDMNDAKLDDVDSDYYAAAIRATRHIAGAQNAINALARGDYQQARRFLALDESN